MDKETLEGLIDRNAPDAAEVLTVNEANSWAADKTAIRRFFRDSDADAVTLMVRGEQTGTELVGVVTRRSFGRVDRTAGDPAPVSNLGTGERITLPGVSKRYKLLKFRCTQCSDVAHLIHYDVRNLPPCKNQHQQWEYLGEA